MNPGDRCPRTGAIIGCPEINRQQREEFYRLNPQWIEPERMTMGRQE